MIAGAVGVAAAGRRRPGSRAGAAGLGGGAGLGTRAGRAGPAGGDVGVRQGGRRPHVPLPPLLTRAGPGRRRAVAAARVTLTPTADLSRRRPVDHGHDQ